MAHHNFDDAADRGGKGTVELNGDSFSSLLRQHVEAALSPFPLQYPNFEKRPKAADRTFISNNEIWEAINYERLRSEMTAVLDSFFVFEWLPRSPGLYYTPKGQYARNEAKKHILKTEDGLITYNHCGKAFMLDGGIGNIRLKPIVSEQLGGEYYFMSASSDGTCHQGFPIAVPANEYQTIIEQVTERGSVVMTVIGTLKFVPDPIESLYNDYVDVPRLCLVVDKLQAPNHAKSRQLAELDVSVAVSFLSDFEGYPRVYATYASFDPGNKGSFRNTLDWIEQDYVSKLYRGRIVADFDQQRSHFSGAPFSLEKVMGLALDQAEIAQLGPVMALSNWQIQRLLKGQASFKALNVEVYMESKYKITGGQQGAVGDNAKAEHFSQLSNGQAAKELDLQILAAELSRVQAAAKGEAQTAHQAAAVGALTIAEVSAKNGDRSATLQYLANAGQWALDIATKIGTAVASNAIEIALGLK